MTPLRIAAQTYQILGIGHDQKGLAPKPTREGDVKSPLELRISLWWLTSIGALLTAFEGGTCSNELWPGQAPFWLVSIKA